VSLITEEPLFDITEALSKALRGAAIDNDWLKLDIAPVVTVDIPDIEEADERNPLKWISLTEPETGRLSGKSAVTMVNKSDGLRTRYGCTSTVSLSDVIDRAGSSLALDLEGRFERKRVMMFSICALIARGVDGVLFL
jgi:hypothetical protein